MRVRVRVRVRACMSSGPANRAHYSRMDWMDWMELNGEVDGRWQHSVVAGLAMNRRAYSVGWTTLVCKNKP